MKKNSGIMIALILIAIALYFIANPLSVVFSENRISLNGASAIIDIQDEELITSAKLTGVSDSGTTAIETGCAFHDLNKGHTQICKDAGFFDTTEGLGYPDPWCDGTHIQCYNILQIPIDDFKILVDGQTVYSCNSGCSSHSFETTDFAGVINSKCSTEFQSKSSCEVPVSATSSRDGVIYNLVLNAEGGTLCIPTTECGAWGECVNGKRDRTCIETCSGDTSTEQSDCSLCENNIQDQDEEGIDCGGVCPECDPGDGSDTNIPKPLIIILIVIAIIFIIYIIWLVAKKR